MANAPNVDTATVNRVRRNSERTNAGGVRALKSPLGSGRKPSGKRPIRVVSATERPAATPNEAAPGERAPDSGGDARTYPKLRRARTQAATRGKSTVREAGATAGRATMRHVNRSGATAGSILVLLTGVGVAFAIIRRPQIITGPLGFITGIFGRFVALFGGGSARNVAI